MLKLLPWLPPCASSAGFAVSFGPVVVRIGIAVPSSNSGPVVVSLASLASPGSWLSSKSDHAKVYGTMSVYWSVMIFR